MTTILAGNEPASFEKVTEGIRRAVEAADACNRPACRRGVLMAVEGATELGVYLSDGRWASVALGMERAARTLAAMEYGQMQVAGPFIAEQLRDALAGVVALRHNRVRH
jgi:hypothetical protein